MGRSVIERVLTREKRVADWVCTALVENRTLSGAVPDRQRPKGRDAGRCLGAVPDEWSHP